nr:putative ribonuclease H-like domain-containing protein [Tanacetum cinerariifolium]
AGTNSTNFSGTKDVAGQEVKKDVSSLRYIALPNWVHDALWESSLSKPQDGCSPEVREGSGNTNPTASTSNPPAAQMETHQFEDILGVTTSLDEAIGVDADELLSEIRPVAQGHIQEEGIDYDEVFAPVARIKAIRLFLAYALFMAFTVYQMDVKSAFLYGTIDEEVYVMQPPGFQDPSFPAKVYKVEKAMYGLHQAPRAWYGTLSKYLLMNGFQRASPTPTLRIHKDHLKSQIIGPVVFLAYASFIGFTVYQMDVKIG